MCFIDSLNTKLLNNYLDAYGLNKLYVDISVQFKYTFVLGA